MSDIVQGSCPMESEERFDTPRAHQPVPPSFVEHFHQGIWTDLNATMSSSAIEVACIHNGFIAGLISLQTPASARATSSSCKLCVWCPRRVSHTSSISLSPQHADFGLDLIGDKTVVGIDIKALRSTQRTGEAEPISHNLTIFAWTTKQFLFFQLEAITRDDSHSVTLFDAVECGHTHVPTLVCVSEDGSHCASVENTSFIIIRCTQLRRRQIINVPREDMMVADVSNRKRVGVYVTAMEFVQADVRDIVFGLENGIIYVSLLRTFQ